MLTAWEKAWKRSEQPIGDSTDTDLPVDMLLDVEMAYHQGEISEAIASLTPAQQQYVQDRFWHGMTDKIITAKWGYPPHALWNNKKYGAKMRLKESLGHLEDVYG